MNNLITTSRPIVIKMFLAALLWVATLHVPYGYYQFMRIAVFALSITLCYIYWTQQFWFGFVLLALNAILFNPFDKIVFTRNEWQEIDNGICVALLLWIVIDVILLFAKPEIKYDKKL